LKTLSRHTCISSRKSFPRKPRDCTTGGFDGLATHVVRINVILPNARQVLAVSMNRQLVADHFDRQI